MSAGDPVRSDVCTCSPAMEIAYVAYTDSGVLLLDAQGVCCRAVARSGLAPQSGPERIVGAQYVATLDLESEGGLVDLPRAGCPMLFAATDDAGRIRLLRTAPVVRFEDRRARAHTASVTHEESTPTIPLVRARPLPHARSPQRSFPGVLPPPPDMPRPTPLPPPPAGRVSSRPPPPLPARGRTPSGIRPAPGSIPPVSVPRAAGISLAWLVRGK